MINNRYLYIFSFISFIVSLYLISFSIYNFPSADDFIYGAQYNINPLYLAFNDYLYGSSGRIFSNTLYYFFAEISNKNLVIYQILPIITFAFFVIVSYLLLSIIFKSFNKKVILSLTSIFILTWFISLDSINDTVFWYGGIFNYLFPMSLMFSSIYLFLKGYYTYKKIAVTFYIILSSIIIFFSSFSNEALFLVFFFIYILIFIYSIYYKNKKLMYMLILNLIVFITAFIFILLAPGSANRAVDGNNILFGIYRGLMSALERGFSYYFATAVIPVSIFLYLIFHNIKPVKIFPKLSYKYHGIIFILLGIILSWVAHFVVSYGLGALGLPPRAKVIPQTFSIITFTISNIYFLHYFNFYDKFLNNPNKSIVFIIVYAVFALISSDDFIGSIIGFGEHKIYYEKSVERYNYIQNADKKSKEIILKTIDVAPYPTAPIDARMLSSDCNYYTNTQLAFYFKYNGCIRLESGIDGENSYTKQYFRFKDYILKDGARIWLYSLLK